MLPSDLAQGSGNRLFVSQISLRIWDDVASKQGAVPDRQRRVAHEAAVLPIREPRLEQAHERDSARWLTK